MWWGSWWNSTTRDVKWQTLDAIENKCGCSILLLQKTNNIGNKVATANFESLAVNTYTDCNKAVCSSLLSSTSVHM